jgi:hypothetical protein
MPLRPHRSSAWKRGAAAAALVAFIALGTGCRPKLDPFAADVAPAGNGGNLILPATVSGPAEDTVYVEIRPVVVNPNLEKKVMGNDVFWIPKPGSRKPLEVYLGYFVNNTPYQEYEAFEAALRADVAARSEKSSSGDVKAVLVWNETIDPAVVTKVSASIAATGVSDIQGVRKFGPRGPGFDWMRRR